MDIPYASSILNCYVPTKDRKEKGVRHYPWSKKCEINLLNAIPSYRQRKHQIGIKEAKRLTLELAEETNKNYPEI
ncbi:hypothetical protein H0185_18525 [Mesobacillus maritimus]|uniref:Uncharacterized protein n=1 Tax=Mesobacillus maritimus TaxID=1643336 RepID=A0ABS7K916_9BACI|nr:hypothetical protein [Mesobacillus maritimus]